MVLLWMEQHALSLVALGLLIALIDQAGRHA